MHTISCRRNNEVAFCFELIPFGLGMSHAVAKTNLLLDFRSTSSLPHHLHNSIEIFNSNKCVNKESLNVFWYVGKRMKRSERASERCKRCKCCERFRWLSAREICNMYCYDHMCQFNGIFTYICVSLAYVINAIIKISCCSMTHISHWTEKQHLSHRTSELLNLLLLHFWHWHTISLMWMYERFKHTVYMLFRILVVHNIGNKTLLFALRPFKNVSPTFITITTS